MKKAILVGTKHSIQRGCMPEDDFKSHLKELCKTHCIKAIAEEIDDKCISIAKNLSDELGISYKIIEPTSEEIKKLKIEESRSIIYQLSNLYEIENWDNGYKDNTLPTKVREEYDKRVQNTYRQREVEWLKRIDKFNIWPIIIICGADHLEPFYKLLVSSKIKVIEKERWGL